VPDVHEPLGTLEPSRSGAAATLSKPRRVDTSVLWSRFPLHEGWPHEPPEYELSHGKYCSGVPGSVLLHDGAVVVV
jgi:hypothetical protein